ncbi:hypothetical protein EAI6_02960 [Enterobacter asburiae]|nr:hypothetical protein EAI6_02960 [Enterobacter asburiae]
MNMNVCFVPGADINVLLIVKWWVQPVCGQVELIVSFSSSKARLNPLQLEVYLSQLEMVYDISN